MKTLFNKHILLAMGVSAALLLISSNSMALDAAYSRTGGFTGFGLGGGAALFLDADPSGDVDLNLQAGVGATEKFTVALNVDGRLMINKDYLVGVIVPGPEFSFFVWEGLYIHAGAGVAMTIPDNADFTVGMDIGVGIGYEKFINTNLAGYLSMDVDYFLINDYSDVITVGFWMGLRYY